MDTYNLNVELDEVFSCSLCCVDYVEVNGVL